MTIISKEFLAHVTNTAITNMLNILQRYAIFYDIMQRRVVIPYRRFGTTYRSQNVGTQLSFCRVISLEDRISHLYRDGRLKSCTLHYYYYQHCCYYYYHHNSLSALLLLPPPPPPQLLLFMIYFKVSLHFLLVAKLQKATTSIVISVRPSAWSNSAPTGRTFI